jgi:hypothetical protein
MNCVKRAVNCKRGFVAKSALFAVHSGFLSFRRAGQRLGPIFCESMVNAPKCAISPQLRRHKTRTGPPQQPYRDRDIEQVP